MNEAESMILRLNFLNLFPFSIADFYDFYDKVAVTSVITTIVDYVR